MSSFNDKKLQFEGNALAIYHRLLARTVRWQIEGQANVSKAHVSGRPILWLFWHEQLHSGPAVGLPRRHINSPHRTMFPFRGQQGPAWPREAWPTGQVQGLRARGGLEVDVAWQKGRGVSAELKASLDGRHRIRPPRGHRILEIRCGRKPLPLSRQPDGSVAVEVSANRRYHVQLELD